MSAIGIARGKPAAVPRPVSPRASARSWLNYWQGRDSTMWADADGRAAAS